MPISFSEFYNEDYYGFLTDIQFSLVDNKIVYNFPIESSVYIYDLERQSSLSIGGESKSSPRIVSPLSWSACQDTDAQMRHYIENVKYHKIIYDPYRNLYYRFHHGEAKGKNPDGSFMNANQKAQRLTVFNAAFDVIYELDIDDRRYILPYAFVGPEGLYLGAPKGDDLLRFKIFKLKVI